MRRVSLIALLGAAALVTQAAGATGQFVEPVRVLYTIQGATPPNNCTTACFGWAGSELGDVDRDGAGEVITSEPFTANGSTYVYSGRKGRPLYRFDGAVPGAQQGYAIADAGDTSGDRVPDILTTAPGDAPGTRTSARAGPGGCSTTLSARPPATSSARPSRVRATWIATGARTSSSARS